MSGSFPRWPQRVSSRWLMSVALCCAGGTAAVPLTARIVRAEAGFENRVLVMNNGKVLEGNVQITAGGYVVERGNSRMMIPNDQVQCTAESLEAAYLTLRDTRTKPTVDDHLTLARWCMTYRLYDHARDELRFALRKDSERAEARKLLMRVEEMLDPNHDEKFKSLATPRKSADGFIQGEVESLGGLSPKTAETFATRVQPILMNKCGLGSCHGATTKSNFRLTPVNRGGGRLHSERNLAMVSQFIDVQRGESSVLLQQIEGTHGGLTHPILSGRAGQEQARVIRQWVLAYAQEKRPEGTSGTLASLGTTRTEVAQAAVRPIDAPTPNAAPPASPSSPPPSRKAKPVDSLDDIVPREPTLAEEDVRKILDDSQADPFDPDLFNVRVHGRKRDRQPLIPPLPQTPPASTPPVALPAGAESIPALPRP